MLFIAVCALSVEARSMIRIEHSTIIQAPVEQVFGYAADYRKWREWYEGVSGVG